MVNINVNALVWMVYLAVCQRMQIGWLGPHYLKFNGGKKRMLEQNIENNFDLETIQQKLTTWKVGYIYNNNYN